MLTMVVLFQLIAAVIAYSMHFLPWGVYSEMLVVIIVMAGFWGIKSYLAVFQAIWETMFGSLGFKRSSLGVVRFWHSLRWQERVGYIVLFVLNVFLLTPWISATPKVMIVASLGALFIIGGLCWLSTMFTWFSFREWLVPWYFFMKRLWGGLLISIGIVYGLDVLTVEGIIPVETDFWSWGLVSLELFLLTCCQWNELRQGVIDLKLHMAETTNEETVAYYVQLGKQGPSNILASFRELWWPVKIDINLYINYVAIFICLLRLSQYYL